MGQLKCRSNFRDLTSRHFAKKAIRQDNGNTVSRVITLKLLGVASSGQDGGL